MSNPNPNTSNLKPYKRGQSGNIRGKTKGTLDMSTRIRRILNSKTEWDKINANKVEHLRARYGKIAVADALIYIQISKAMEGDTAAFNAVRKAGYGDSAQLEKTETTDVVHIFKPEKLSIEDLQAQSHLLRERAILKATIGMP